MHKRTFVIGDVHGCYQTLKELLFNICNINIGDELIFIGDLIDKGPDSKSVLDLLIDIQSKSYDITLIRGNHEQMFLNSINNAKAMKEWFRNGGKNTLDSFDAFHPGFLDDIYINFIMSSKYYYLNEGFVIAHAGLNFNIPNPLTDLEKMLTIRTESNYKSKIGNRKLITGHTPITLDKVKLSLSTDLIRIDGGCVYYKQVQGLGYLVAIELNSYELFYLQNIDYDI